MHGAFAPPTTSGAGPVTLLGSALCALVCISSKTGDDLLGGRSFWLQPWFNCLENLEGAELCSFFGHVIAQDVNPEQQFLALYESAG